MTSSSAEKRRKLRLDIISRYLVLTALVASWLLCLTPTAVMARAIFHKGQKVEFDNGGAVKAGEVIAITETGQVKIRYQENGQDLVATCAASGVWLPKRTAIPQTQQGFELHLWTRIDGERFVTGRFVNLTAGKVILQKTSGDTVSIALEDLSEKDQALANRLAAKVAARATAERVVVPDAVINDAAVIPMENEPSFDLTADDKIVAPDGDWSSVKDAMVDLSANSKYLPDGVSFNPNDMPRFIALDPAKTGGRRDFSLDEVCGFFLDREHQRLVVATTNLERAGSLYGPRLEVCNLRDGQSMSAVTLNTGIVPCDLSPDGQSIVCMPTELVASFSKRRGIEVWRLEKSGTLAKRWNPNDTRGKEGPYQVDYARFISPNLLMTVNTGGGKLTVWDIANVHAVYSLPIVPFSRPALSAGRKQLVALCSGVICVFDAETGVTRLALPESAMARGITGRGRNGEAGPIRCALRSDGRLLALMSKEQLQVWDLPRQTLVREMWFSDHSLRRPPEIVEWIDHEHLLVNGAELIDVPRRIVTWHYQVPHQNPKIECVVNGTLAFGHIERLTIDDRSVLQAGVHFLRVPHDAAMEVETPMSSDSVLALKAGSEVSLDFKEGRLKPDDVETLTVQYTAQLKAFGIKIVKDTGKCFRATVEDGRVETKVYNGTDQGRDETVTAKKLICRLGFYDGGGLVWERSIQIGGAPDTLYRSNAKSAQAAVDAANSRATVRFFASLRLPGMLARQGPNGAYGFSKVLPNGVEPYDPSSQ